MRLKGSIPCAQNHTLVFHLNTFLLGAVASFFTTRVLAK